MGGKVLVAVVVVAATECDKHGVEADLQIYCKLVGGWHCTTLDDWLAVAL